MVLPNEPYASVFGIKAGSNKSAWYDLPIVYNPEKNRFDILGLEPENKQYVVITVVEHWPTKSQDLLLLKKNEIQHNRDIALMHREETLNEYRELRRKNRGRM